MRIMNSIGCVETLLAFLFRYFPCYGYALEQSQ